MENVPFPYRLTSVQTARTILFQKEEEEKMRKMIDLIVSEKMNEMRCKLKAELLEELKQELKHDRLHDGWEKINMEKQN
jgi:Spy/CpxP family protein refolding chaperone